MDFSIHQIFDIRPSIKKFEQIIDFDCVDFARTLTIGIETFANKTKIDISEAEILINSKMKIHFYSIGEILKNGNKCQKNKENIKGVEIIQADSIEKMRINNLERLLYFNSIRNISQGVNKNGNKFTKIQLDNLTSFFVNDSYLKKITGLNIDEYHFLVGELVSPVFYKAGEITEPENRITQKDNTIVKYLNLRLNDTIENFRKFK